MVIENGRFSVPAAFVVMRVWIPLMPFVLCGSVFATALVLKENPGAAVVAGRPHVNLDPEWVREQLSHSA